MARSNGLIARFRRAERNGIHLPGRASMRRSRSAGLCLFALVSLLAVSCETKPFSVRDLRIGRQLPGWTEEKKRFVYFTQETLYDLINGGATEYIDNGMTEGFFQRLAGPDSAQLDIYAEDFGSPKNARAIFALKRRPPQDSVLSAEIDTSALMLSKVIGGVWACGIVDRFYFELTLMPGGDPAKAKETVKSIFDSFRKKIRERVK